MWLQYVTQAKRHFHWLYNAIKLMISGWVQNGRNHTSLITCLLCTAQYICQHCTIAGQPFPLPHHVLCCSGLQSPGVFQTDLCHHHYHSFQLSICQTSNRYLVDLDWKLNRQAQFVDRQVSLTRAVFAAHKHALLIQHCVPFRRGHTAPSLCL